MCDVPIAACLERYGDCARRAFTTWSFTIALRTLVYARPSEGVIHVSVYRCFEASLFIQGQ